MLGSAKYDVVVVGGGTSGVSAAIASARVGASTILVERLGALGGEMNVSGPPGFAYAYLFNQRGEQVIGGIVEETYRRLLENGHAYPHIDPEWRGSYVLSYVDPDWWGLLVFEMMTENGVDLLLHSLAVDVLKEDATVTGVVVETPSGRIQIKGKVVIDCTGSGEIAVKCGVPFVNPPREQIQPHSVAFTVDGVDWDKALEYIKGNLEEFKFDHFIQNPYSIMTKERLEAQIARASNIAEIGEIMGYVSLRDAALERSEWHGFSGVGYFLLPREGGVMQAHFQHASQVPCCDTTDVRDLTRGEIECRKQIGIAWKFIRKYLPGFEKAYVTRVCPEMRIRESRRIVGDYVLTRGDVVEARKFGDVIGKSSMPAGRHHVASAETLGGAGGDGGYPREGGSHDIPYRCLVPKGVENLLVGGRAISTDRDAYQRYLAQTMITGQAAGVAAAVGSAAGLTPRQLEMEIADLQGILVGQGAILVGTH